MPTSVTRAAWVASTIVAFTLLLSPRAHAAESFAMSPGGGPVGTVVHVDGHDCAPGALPLPDFVQINATTVPPTAIQLPVDTNGAWHGSFAVPAATPPGDVVVSAVCTSDDVASLMVLYAPRTFVVSTSATATTATTVTGAPRSTTTTTAVRHDTPTTRVADGTPPAAPANGAPGAVAAAAAHTSVGSDVPPSTPGTTARAPEAGVARAAGTASSHVNAPGLMWLVALLLLCIGAGAFVWLWWTRTHEPALDPD
jgi:hypothetical protein